LIWALDYLAGCKLLTGSIEAVIPLAEQAIRLSPRDPDIGWRYSAIGTVHLLQSRTDEAIVWLEKARNAIPASSIFRSRLASAYALRGETDRAVAELAEAQRLNGVDLFSSIARLKASPCQRRRENAPAGRSKIASLMDGRGGRGCAESFKQCHPELSFPVRSNEPAFPSRPGNSWPRRAA
jgi:tetratricopeptide (TPR) repeat protein